MENMVNWQIVVDKERTNLFIQTTDWLQMFFTNVEDCGNVIRFMNKLPEHESKVVEEYLRETPNLHILEWTGTSMLATVRSMDFIKKCNELEKS